MTINIKNNLKGITSEGHFPQLEWINSKNLSQFSKGVFDATKVNILFCVEGQVIYQFSPYYSKKLESGKAFIIYNPEKELNYNLSFNIQSEILWMSISLEQLHNLFAPDSQHAPIFNLENAQRKYYEEKEIPHALLWTIKQIPQTHLIASAKRLYMNAKAIEILSIFFSTNTMQNALTVCPFLNDESMVLKIKNAKEILFQEYAEPPSIPELAKRIGINELQLKIGFKEIYGNSPYQYLKQYKLEMARHLISGGKLRVSEVANKIGYSNVSHFIEEFRKQFGVTPKKFALPTQNA